MASAHCLKGLAHNKCNNISLAFGQWNSLCRVGFRIEFRVFCPCERRAVWRKHQSSNGGTSNAGLICVLTQPKITTCDAENERKWKIRLYSVQCIVQSNCWWPVVSFSIFLLRTDPAQSCLYPTNAISFRWCDCAVDAVKVLSWQWFM